ncbi:MAG: helicase, partial [Sulfurovum sp.]|nr:helicase [Sulfurovum sp.]
MAKKKKKYLIKLNNKIRNYFNGLPFDEGIDSVDDGKLIELIMLLELQLPSHEHDDMVRALRRTWSEEGAGTRELIVSYLTQSYKSTHNAGSYKESKEPYQKKKPLDKVDKILQLLENIEHTKQEENLILDAFINVKNAKITGDKVLTKLGYLRIKSRLNSLEKSLDVVFTTNNEMEFYHRFTFALKEVDFSKQLLCKTDALSLDSMWDLEEDILLDKLRQKKQGCIAQKTLEHEAFLKDINSKEHPYLTDAEVQQSLKSMPPESALNHAPVSLNIIEKILVNISDKYEVFESTDHIIIEKEKNHDLFGTLLYYVTSASYEKPYFYNLLWQGAELPVKEDINRVNDDLLGHFRVAIDDVLEEMKEDAEKLNIDDAVLHDFVVRFVEPQIRSSNTLKFREKSKRRILFHFGEYIKPLLEKQKREELLAKTIRDFKNLFPLARALKRKIVFHVGPTNSGKTYAALKELESAVTGYYLAPLRLLALEGYENLRKNDIHASLITGEEEIIDEESTHISSTIEMMNGSVEVDVCVIDEIQMISDRDRGWAWANALMGVPAKKVILTGSANALPA